PTEVPAMANPKARKLTLVRKPNDQIRLEEGEAVHVGVDVPKAPYSVALFSYRRGLIATWGESPPAEGRPRAAAAGPRGDRPGRLRGRADGLRPGPPAPVRGPRVPGHRA